MIAVLADLPAAPLGGLLDGAAAGNEDAFLRLVTIADGSLRRLARALLGPEADGVMSDLWMAIVGGWPGRDCVAEARIRQWLAAIVVEHVRTHIGPLGVGGAVAPSVSADRFLPADHKWAGHWAQPPQAWDEPSSADMLASVRCAIDDLPDASCRAVVVLRDVEGFPGPVVADLLGIDEAAQRRLLHRGRTVLRAALERRMTTV